MWRFLPLLTVLVVAACDLPEGEGNQSMNQPWGPDEKMSNAGKRDCDRPIPPQAHPERSKYNRVCLKVDN